MKAIIKDTNDVLFEGEIDRVSSFNEVGKFDIYPMHANFISIILKELTLYKNNQLLKEIKLEKAIMKVKQDIVNIYLGIESLAIEDEMLGESQPDKNITSATSAKK